MFSVRQKREISEKREEKKMKIFKNLSSGTELILLTIFIVLFMSVCAIYVASTGGYTPARVYQIKIVK